MRKKLLRIGGQISLVTTVIVSGATLMASIIGSWGFASTKVSVIEERENNHYEEVQKQLSSIEKKLDAVIETHQVVSKK